MNYETHYNTSAAVAACAAVPGREIQASGHHSTLANQECEATQQSDVERAEVASATSAASATTARRHSRLTVCTRQRIRRRKRNSTRHRAASGCWSIQHTAPPRWRMRCRQWWVTDSCCSMLRASSCHLDAAKCQRISASQAMICGQHVGTWFQQRCRPCGHV